MLHGFPLQVSITCPSCHQPMHVQGLSETTICAACSQPMNLPLETWLSWFGPEEIAEAIGLPDGEACQVTSMGGISAKYAYGHRMPRCQACKTAVPADRLGEYAAAGGLNCTCGERIRVRAADAITQVIVPGAQWVVNEGVIGSDPVEPQTAAQPMLFACMACGGSLTIDGKDRTVTCTFCGGSNYLPDGLWLRMHPPQTVRVFFVVADTGSAGAGVPVELLERLAASEEASVRKAAAANPGLPRAVMQRLLGDDDSDVRKALATNDALPVELLVGLARDENSDIREAVAANPETPAEVVTALVADDDWEVRRAAVRTGRIPDAVLAKRIPEESDSDVLAALASLALGPLTLDRLATSDNYTARRAAAQHPATSPELLTKLASDHDSDVLEAVVHHPAVPPAALLILAGSDNPKVAEAARTRPEFATAVSSRRKRLLIGVLVGGLIVTCLGGVAAVVGGAALAAQSLGLIPGF